MGQLSETMSIGWMRRSVNLRKAPWVGLRTLHAAYTTRQNVLDDGEVIPGTYQRF